MFEQIKFLAAAAVGAAVLASSPVVPAAPVVPAGPPASCQVDPQCDAFRPVYFQDYVPGNGHVRGVYRMNPDGSERVEIIPNASSPSVDRARTQIAFLRAGEIWIAKADGSDQRQVTERGISATDISLSPDGDHIAYSHGDNRIDVIRLGTSDRCSGFSDSEGGPLRGFSPKWSPDGIHLAYALSGDSRGVGTAHCNGSDRRVVVAGNVGGYVDWSDDGSRVSYNPVGDMAWVDVQAPGVGHPIPNSAVIAGNASWSPDGQRLVITRTASQNRGIWTIRLDGTEAVKITNIADHSGRPDWGYPAAPVVGKP